jgi:hypothetical protein
LGRASLDPTYRLAICYCPREVDVSEYVVIHQVGGQFVKSKYDILPLVDHTVGMLGMLNEPEIAAMKNTQAGGKALRCDRR